MAIPQGWKPGNGAGIYEANITQTNVSTGSVSIVAETNSTNGNYNVYTSNGINFLGGRTPLYSVSPSGAVTVQNQQVYNQLQQSGTLTTINNSVKQRSFEINQAVATPQQKAAVANSTLYKSLSNAAPQPPAAPAAAADTPADAAANPADYGTKVAGTDIKGERMNRYGANGSLAPLVYPVNRQGYGGDYIQFEIRSYQKSGLASPTAQGRSTAKDVTLLGMEKRQSIPRAYIYLPIQSGISDSMSVDWGTGELSPITAAFANAAYNIINRAGEGNLNSFGNELGKSARSLVDSFGAADEDIRKMMVNSFTQRAVGVEGLLSRTVGGALNNNLELLFNGPMLRSFTFNFKLTPREPDEAKIIKEIIRYFKKSMVPGLSDSKLFLLAPNVFKIKYIYTGRGDIAQSHPYLNKIKVAALRDFSVNYTPDGNYMTYDDPNGKGAGSMTQYDLSMTFGEIDPIYEPDYESGEGLEGMGW